MKFRPFLLLATLVLALVGAHWFRAQTYLAANLILDDLFATLTDVEPRIPSPAAEYVTAEAAS